MFALVEVCLLKLEDAPWHAAYRVLIGFCFVLIAKAFQPDLPAGLFLAFLAVVLFGLRVGPALIRRAVPFSKAAQERWALRRYWAKLYDSYQWQKLLWIGVGMALGAVLTRRVNGYEMAVAAFCVLSGALGAVFWRSRKKQLEPVVVQ